MKLNHPVMKESSLKFSQGFLKGYMVAKYRYQGKGLGKIK